MYTKQSLKAQEFSEFDDLNFKESIWCTFETDNKEKVLIGNIYHSPNSDIENTMLLLNILQDDNNKFKHFDKVIITGDFNFPNIKWNDEDLTGKDELFYNALQDGYFVQHVTKPTRHRKDQESNILDLVITHNETDIQTIEHCSPIGKSDHELLKITTNLLKQKIFDEEPIKLNLEKGKYDLFRKFIFNTDWSVLKDFNTEQCWKYIYDKIEEGIKLFIPVKKFSNRKKKPIWSNGHVKKSVKKKYKLYKRWLESENSYDYQIYIKERNETAKLIKKAKKDHEKKIAQKSKENPKMFWNYINSQRKCKESIPVLKGKDGKMYTDNYNKTCILNDFFSSVFTKEDMNNLPNMTPGDKSNNIFISEISNITEENVSIKSKAINLNKSCGPELTVPFTYLFDLSLK